MILKAVVRLIIILIFIFTPLFLFGAENYLSHSIRVTILVADPEHTADILTQWVEDLGGYYLFRSKDRVTLRIPYEEIGNLRSYLENIAEELVKVNLEAHDLRESILQLRSGLQAREEILEQNLEYIDKTDVKGTLAIEQEIRRLIEEIESHKGRLRKLEADRRFAYGEVHLSFKEQTLPEDIPSSFGWINTIDFYRFMQKHLRVSSYGIKPKVEIPEGFAIAKSRRIYKTISPEGMLYRVRKVKNYPEQDLEFWGTALKSHLIKEGYFLKNESVRFQSINSEGVLYEWIMPFANEDYIYLTAITLSRKEIVIAESAAEHTVYKKYRQPILNSLETISLRPW